MASKELIVKLNQNTDDDSDDDNINSNIIQEYCDKFNREQVLGAFFRGPPLRKRAFPSSSEALSGARAKEYLNITPNSYNKHKEDKLISSPDTARHPDDLKSLDVSSASRQCEWDSFGDVGYENVNKETEKELSTLEKMALSKHRIVDREDPVPENFTIGLPEAQSTPADKSPVTFKILKSKKSFKCHKKPNKPKLNINQQPSRTVENFNIDLAKHYSINIGAGDNTNPACDVPSINISNLPPNNSEDKTPKAIDVSKEISVQTNEDKGIQTVSMENVAISAQASLEFKKPERPNIETSSVPSTSNPGPIIFNIVAPVNKKKTYVSKRHTWSSPFQTNMSKSQSTDSNDEDNPEVSPSTQTKFSESLLSRADSFEYMPGHLYINENQARKTISSTQSSHSSHSKESLESYVELVHALVNKRHDDPLKKKQLGNKIVNLIMNSSSPTTEPSCKRGIDFTKTKPNETIESTEEFDPQKERRIDECLNLKDSFYLDFDKNLHNKYKQPFRSCVSEPIFDRLLLKNNNDTNLTLSAPASLLLNTEEPIYQDLDSCKSTCGSIDEKPIDPEEEENIKEDRVLSPPSSKNVQSSSSSSISKEKKKSSPLNSKEIYKNLNLINLKISELNSLMKKHIHDKEKKPEAGTSLPIQKAKLESPKALYKNVEIPPLNLHNSSDEWTERNENMKSSSSKNTFIEIETPPQSLQVEESVYSKDTMSSLSIKSLAPSSHQSYLNSLTSKSSVDKTSETFNVSAEVGRAEKLINKYQKCKIMKAFMKDYEELIIKYHQMKVCKAKYTKRDQDSQETSVQSKDLSKSSSKSSSVSVDAKKTSKSGVTSKDCQTDFSKNDVATSPLGKSTSRSKSSIKTSVVISHSKLNTRKTDTAVEKPKTESVSTNVRTKSKNFENRLRKFLDQEYIRLVNEYKTSYDNNDSNKIVHEASDASKVTSKCLDLTDATLKTDSSFQESNRQTPEKIHSKPKEKVELTCDCKEVSVSCKSCRRKLIKTFLKKKQKEQNADKKEYPRPVAYNLVLLQSDSICQKNKTERKKRLEEVVIKVPNIRQKVESGNKVDFEYVKDIPRIDITVEGDVEEKGSTDEQLKELSSLNSDKGPNRGVIHSVGEYLKMNRPEFFDSADKRWNLIKQQHQHREFNSMVMREIVRLGLMSLPCSKHINETDLQNIAKLYGIEIPKGNSVFNSKSIVQNTKKKYKKLPEVQQKKENIKKQQKKRENQLMLDLFSKKLQQNVLKGVVNTSHTTKVLSL